ncbi:MAG TPA: PilZ domain-containing protein [Candidatus Dormibacteraeota bacterium]|nr:PilZ domain-containing protein [Candidatus Dormibacteraeota bacterium]
MDTDKKARAAAASAESGSPASSDQPATGQPSGSKAAFTRRFPRFVIDVRLQVKMFQAGEFRNCWGRSTEMGQDGIGATLTGSLETGEIVTLEIPLPLSPYPIKVRAIVRYRQGLRYGFEFLTLNDNQRDTIKRVCQYLATRA